MHNVPRCFEKNWLLSRKDWSGQLINDPTESLGFRWRQYHRKCRLGRPATRVLSLLVFKAAPGKKLSKKNQTDASSFTTKWIENWGCTCKRAENWHRVFPLLHHSVAFQAQKATRCSFKGIRAHLAHYWTNKILFYKTKVDLKPTSRLTLLMSSVKANWKQPDRTKYPSHQTLILWQNYKWKQTRQTDETKGKQIR